MAENKSFLDKTGLQRLVTNLKNLFLSKTNTTAYTPTANYHPATKKYVDDNKYSLPTASSSVLGGVKVGTNLSISSGVLSAKDTTYGAATQTANGLMTSTDKAKLDGIASGANAYSLPTATSSVLGGVKIGSNINVSSGTISLTKANVTSALGYTPPTTNTTYNNASTTAAGLMSASDKSKLDGIASGANAYSLPTASASTLGGVKVGTNLSISNGVLSATNTTYSAATTSAAGLMSAADKTKLNGIATGATANSASTTTPKANGTASTGSESGYSRGDHIHPLQTTVSGNAGSATKLATARSISLGTAVSSTATNFDGTGNITIPVTGVKEAYLTWGGKNIVGGVSPIGASLSSEHSANRIAFLNPAALTIEYSNDGGSTWTDAGLSNTSKINFVTRSEGITIGSATTVTTNHRTRVTLTAQNGSGDPYVYIKPRKMLLNVNTVGHGIQVLIERKTGASGATWQTVGTYQLNGWSGWNDMPLDITTLGGGKTQTGNNWYLRLTFSTTSVHADYTSSKSQILGMRIFGDAAWTIPSNMAGTGHLYSYDWEQTATFPNGINAKVFVENGTALSSKYAAASHGTHVTYATATPKANGTAAVGTSTKVAREDHVHPLQTTISGNAATATKATQDGNGNVITSTYLPFSGGTLTGSIQIGSSTTSTAPTVGIKVHDIRDVTVKPNTMGDRNANFYFTNDSGWKSVMRVKGWNGSYATWELSGNADTSASNTLRYRNGVGETWNAWKTIAFTDSNITGNAGTATKLATARTISLTGDVTGSASFDGSANASITATIADDSHNHVISNIDNLQTTLNGKLSTGGGTITGALTVNGALTANATTKTPFSTTGNLNFVNRKLDWNANSYIQNVILLIPVLTSTNWSGYNYIDGKFLCWKTGGNVYDVVEINMNCVYNNLRYHLEFYGDHPTWELCICKYNNVNYYALKCPYHANPYTNVEFTGHVRSELTGGTSTVALPLGVAYYNENTQTVLNSEVKNSLTTTLTNSYVTNVSCAPLYSKGGFTGTFNGTATKANQLTTARKIAVGNSEKTFDGTANVTWTLDEIGAADKTTVNNRFDSVEGDIETLFANINSQGEVTSVKTTQGWTFNNSGMNIGSTSTFNTAITTSAATFKNGSTTVATIDGSGLMATTINNQGAYQYGYANGTYLFKDELITIDGEYAVATFYNGT